MGIEKTGSRWGTEGNTTNSKPAPLENEAPKKPNELTGQTSSTAIGGGNNS